MEKNNRLILNVLGYLVAFIAVQFVVSLVALYLDDSITPTICQCQSPNAEQCSEQCNPYRPLCVV